MPPKTPPDIAARQFFASMMEGKCHHSWALFSNASQKKFLEWSLQEVYKRNNDAASYAQLSAKEIKLMFENNDPTLIKFFWKRFFYTSSANELFRFGYFSVNSIKGKKAVVKVTLKYPDGNTRDIGLPMVNERGGWKLAYAENGLPF